MSTHIPTARKPLRLRPGVVLVVAEWVLWLLVPALAPDVEVSGLPLVVITMFASLLCGVGVALWWLFFSRAPWIERVAAIVVMILALMALPRVAHESIVGAHMGVTVYLLPIHGLALALVVWAAATQHLSPVVRRTALVAAIVLACVPWTLIRTAGVSGSGSEYHWRWTPTPEERLLAEMKDLPSPAAAPAVAFAPAVTAVPSAPLSSKNASGTETKDPKVIEPGITRDGPAMSERGNTARDGLAMSERGNTARDGLATSERGNTARDGLAISEREITRVEWPGFRGPERNAVVRDVRIETDWSASPPMEMWRRAVGPGWSSFAVAGDLLYTQEQRGEEEIVACYRVATGEPVWAHRDRVRFWESNGGAGPRATPTLHNGRVYAFGATGILNALDARTGARLWSRNVSTDLNRRVPDWGFASSPLVFDDLVIVAAAGTLAAYDLATGDLRWQGPRYGASYSSPHRATLDGVDQIVLQGGPGVISVAPQDGRVLWEHKWEPGTIVQPALTPDGDILVNAMVATGGVGTRRLHVTQSSNGWNVEERWTSNGLKPYFNDFVIHEGHAYGFDNNILAAIDLTDGTRKWKAGRFGHGQLLLLADQDLLLLISEDGELALVAASPEKFTEVARFEALNAKTWNHPVIVGDVLLVRNGEEMAAFRLPARVAVR
jgi:outer membrane protein assembly factor BamB